MIESSRSKKIQQDLRSMILIDEEFKAGDRIPTEYELAEKYQVSRPIVREAIRALEAQGMLVTRHGSGTYVSDHPGFSNDPLGLSDISDKTLFLEKWYEARQVIETDVVRLIIENATEEELSHLKDMVDQTEESIKKGDKEFLNTDRKFHIALASATHNSIIERLMIVMMQSFYYSIADSLRITWYKSGMENAMVHHRQIIKSLYDRDVEAAKEAVRSHMAQAIRDIEQKQK